MFPSPPPELLRALLDRNHITQQAAAGSQQLLAFAGERQPASHTIEELQAKLLFEIGDLAG